MKSLKILRLPCAALLVLGLFSVPGRAEQPARAPRTDTVTAGSAKRLAAQTPSPTLRRISDDIVGDSAAAKPQGSTAGGLCDPGCDICWCGTSYENNCHPSWEWDTDCDCGCQFCDVWCGDCAMQDCGGGGGGACCCFDLSCLDGTWQGDCEAADCAYRGDGSTCQQGCPCDNMPQPCEWCWIGTQFENNCSPDWYGTNDGCDCGCQWVDPDCGSPAGGACCCPDLSCEDGTSQGDCDVAGCTYRGDGSTCQQGCPCDNMPQPCQWCWIGTQFENNCPAEWCNDTECDCGCQWDDYDCGGPPCPDPCDPVCGDGLCECDCDETIANCAADCVDAPCGDAPVEDLCLADTRELCVVTFTTCPCGSECYYCNQGDCDPAWNDDGYCDCGCQFCDVDCPEDPPCCIAGPAQDYVYTGVYPPTCGSTSPSEGWSEFDPGSGDYLFCAEYTAGACADDACVRFWLDDEGTCDPELWWRFHQNDPAVCCGDLPAIVGTDPPNCEIDARQPAEPDGTMPCEGWNSIDIAFAGDVSCLGPQDLRCYVVPALGPAPNVVGVVLNGPVATVQLDSVIPAGRWTCISHDASGAQVCLGALPADVDGTRTSDSVDIPEVINCLNEAESCEPWQCDVNCSGRCGGADILRVIDLLNGADAYPVWLEASLPVCPSPG